jgi:hypothetical protein
VIISVFYKLLITVVITNSAISDYKLSHGELPLVASQFP